MVANILGLDESSSEFEVTRVKPSLYLIVRGERVSVVTGIGASVLHASCASSATFPDVTERLPEEYWHEIVVSARIMAENDAAAMAKLSIGIQRELRGEKHKSSTREFSVKCDRSDYRPRESTVERNGLYTHLRFFEGGSARGK
jgi:hypothetical protein